MSHTRPRLRRTTHLRSALWKTAPLLFVHQGMDDPKEAKYHPQIPGLVMTTAADGFSVVMPNI